MALSGHEGAKQRHVVSGDEDAENSMCPMEAADVIGDGGAGNGLAATADAACAASVRRVLALLDDGDVVGARALLEQLLQSS